MAVILNYKTQRRDNFGIIIWVVMPIIRKTDWLIGEMCNDLRMNVGRILRADMDERQPGVRVTPDEQCCTQL